MDKRFVKEYANFEIERIANISGLPFPFVTERIGQIQKQLRVYEKGITTETDAIKKINELADVSDVGRIGQPVTFYTGGGIWITAMHNGNDRGYYTVDNETDDISQDYLTFYDNAFTDGYEFPCCDYVWSKNVSELTEKQKAIYTVLKNHLKENAR